MSLSFSQLHDCAGQPCQNGGRYSDGVNNDTSNCVAGYTGQNCSVGKNDRFLF